MKKNEEKGVVSIIVTTLIGLVLGGLLYYIFLVPIRFTPSFIVMSAITIVITCFMLTIVLKDRVLSDAEERYLKGGVSIAVLSMLFVIIGLIASMPIFHSESYKNCITVEKKTDGLESVLPSINEKEKFSLMDTKSAEKLGDRTLGGLVDLVSQYEVGKYETIAVNGAIKKIAPLEYGSFFKAVNNKTIPGYVIVDPVTNEASFVTKEFKVSPSAYFKNDLKRTIRRSLKHDHLGDTSFQLDDLGNPYWVISIVSPKTLWGNKVPTGVAVVNATNGDVKKYSLKDVPEWVDQTMSGETMEEMYDRHGRYIHGFFNFSDKGKTKVTDDYGYVIINNVLHYYTGVTSVTSDESNLGFLLVNSNNGTYEYYPSAGAEEYSAMSAAEGVVQNYGYEASFPSLVLIEAEPTYVMVLKDSQGLVKKFALVKYTDYTRVIVEDTLEKCISIYTGKKEGDNLQTPEGYVRIDEIHFIVDHNQTICYVVSDGNLWKKDFEEKQLLLKKGDLINSEEFISVEIK